MTEYIEEPPRRHLRYDPRRSGGEAAYRTAQRHSRLVRGLKYALPALALAGVGLFLATAHFIPSDLASLISVSGIDIDSKSIVMEKPHISGFEGTRRAYDVTAESAVQALDDPKVMTFKTINAHLGMEEAGSATVDAGTGVYDSRSNKLLLKDGIKVSTTNGHSATLQAALIDLAKGSLTSDRPVEIRAREGTVRANSIEVSERGKHIIFRNGVSVTYLPPDELAAAPADQPAPKSQ